MATAKIKAQGYYLQHLRTKILKANLFCFLTKNYKVKLNNINCEGNVPF